MTVAQIFNLALYRTRSAGVNFAGNPAPPASAITPLPALYLLGNQAYAELLARAVDYLAFVAQEVQFLTTGANTVAAQSVALLPINGNAALPCALKVLECTYTQAKGATFDVPIVSTDRFKEITGGYQRRLGNYNSIPEYCSQQYGESELQIYPGFGVNGDTVTLTVIPDPSNGASNASAATGGPLAALTDVPLGPPAFHMAIVDYLVWQISDAQGNMGPKGEAAQQRWMEYIESLGEFGSAFGQGDPEQRVSPIFNTMQRADL